MVRRAIWVREVVKKYEDANCNVEDEVGLHVIFLVFEVSSHEISDYDEKRKNSQQDFRDEYFIHSLFIRNS